MLYLQPLKNHRYRVVNNYTYKEITVPTGYITNGANIPRIFWSFIPPNKSDIMEAVVIHDYLCDQGMYELADRYFKELLLESEVSTVTVFVMHGAVTSYHYLRYELFKKEQQ